MPFRIGPQPFSVSRPQHPVKEPRDTRMPPRPGVFGPFYVGVVPLLHAVVHVLDEVFLDFDEGFGAVVRPPEEELT